jgi:hypothetical protein
MLTRASSASTHRMQNRNRTQKQHNNTQHTINGYSRIPNTWNRLSRLYFELSPGVFGILPVYKDTGYQLARLQGLL